MMSNRVGQHTFEDDLRDAFQLFDRDSNGFISKRELTFVMTRLRGEEITDAAVENMIKEVDLDGDGRVNYEGECHGCKGVLIDRKQKNIEQNFTLILVINKNPISLIYVSFMLF